jgi:hypothetical protein
MRGNAEIKMRFRRIFEWAGLPPFVCGWPNFEQADYHDGRGTVYGHYLLTDAVADWQDARYAQDLMSPAENPLRGWFTHAHDFAVAQGYQHGFPNFEQANYNDGRGNVYGIHLIVAGTAEFRDVPATTLFAGIGNADPETLTMDEWFWAAARFATSNGFVAGMPTGHRANYNDGRGFVCGVFLFPAGTAQWVDVPEAQLFMGQTTPPPSGKITVSLDADASGALRVGMVSDPEAWEKRDARITAVSTDADQEITLSHTDLRANATVSGIRVPARGVTSAFNGLGVAGSWAAQLSRLISGQPALPFNIEIGWTAMA